jgi:adenosylcobinamide amidohydrolase
MLLELRWHGDEGTRLPAAVWRPGQGYRMISSAVVGGGIGPREWVLNAQVPGAYSRTDPAAHVAEVAAGLGLSGPGIGMLTAAPVSEVVEREAEGVQVAATVGLRVPTWAAAPPGETDPGLLPVPGRDPVVRPGTINVIVSVPVPLTDPAYVNAVVTATEAKTQAILDAGFPGTGTATDAICIAAPAGGVPRDFAGPRSLCGASIARAVHAAVHTGALRYAARHRLPHFVQQGAGKEPG